MANVKLEQPATNGALRFLESDESSKALFAIGAQTKRHLIDNWLQGKGGDGVTFKELKGTAAYLEMKVAGEVIVRGKKRTGDGIINMHLTGAMANGITKRRQGKTKVNVTFFKGEQPKAEGNVAKRPNMMQIDDDFIAKALAFYNKRMKSAIKRGKV